MGEDKEASNSLYTKHVLHTTRFRGGINPLIAAEPKGGLSRELKSDGRHIMENLFFGSRVFSPKISFTFGFSREGLYCMEIQGEVFKSNMSLLSKVDKLVG